MYKKSISPFAVSPRLSEMLLFEDGARLFEGSNITL
jgi:hypothetical protein